MKLLTSAAQARKLVAPPVSVGCLVCHGQFFSASLSIHQKTCFQRNAFVLIPCEKCKSCIRAYDFHSHSASCMGKPVLFDYNSVTNHTNGLKQHTDRTPMDLNPPDLDGRVRCKVCERAFLQNRISKHQSVCHGKPRSLKEKHEPRRPRYVLPVRPVSDRVKRPRRKIIHIQRALTSQPREVSFDFVPDRNNRVEDQQRRDTSRCQSCIYPGSKAMQGGGCETSNASSASNPLVTNPLMTMRRSRDQ